MLKRASPRVPPVDQGVKKSSQAINAVFRQILFVKPLQFTCGNSVDTYFHVFTAAIKVVVEGEVQTARCMGY